MEVFPPLFFPSLPKLLSPESKTAGSIPPPQPFHSDPHMFAINPAAVRGLRHRAGPVQDAQRT